MSEATKKTKKKESKKKGSDRKKILMVSLVVLVLLGFGLVPGMVRINKKKKVWEAQKEVMIGRWEEMGLSEEEINKRMESFNRIPGERPMIGERLGIGEESKMKMMRMTR